MGKSLTETAKAVLQGQNLAEEANQALGGNQITVKDTGVPNQKTLRPMSRGAEGQIVNPGANSTPGNQAQDLGGATPTSTAKENLGAKAAGKRDSSRSSYAAVPAEKVKTQAEVMEEDLELDEEQIDEVLDTLPKLMGYVDAHNKSHKKALETGDKNTARKRERGAEVFKRQFAKAQGRSLKEEDAGDHDPKGPQKKGESDRDYERRTGRSPEGKSRIEPRDDLEENFEISEELESFIDAMVAEGYSEEQIAEAIEENFEFVTEEEAYEDYQVDMSEHVDALLQGEELSEEFKEKAKTIFEAAVKQKVEEEIARLEEAYAETLEEEIADITANLTENVDDYLSYVVEQWVGENEIAIEAGLRTELTEEFISGLKNLFEENYIDIPEEKISVIDELTAKVEQLEEKLNEEIDTNVTLNKMLSESRKYEIISSATEGLTVTQAEKLKTFAENIEFTSADEYNEKLMTIRESYFPEAPVVADRALDKAESGDNQMMLEENSPMAKYVQVLGKTLPKSSV